MASSTTLWAVLTAETTAVKLTVFVPEGTVIEAGTVTALLLLVRVTG